MSTFEELGIQAQERFKQLGYDNVTAKVADGYYGWEEFAPFDGIIVTCAADHVPPSLIQQLKPGGRMVIPVGKQYGTQYMVEVNKDRQGKISQKKHYPVRFVPMTGDPDPK